MKIHNNLFLTLYASVMTLSGIVDFSTAMSPDRGSDISDSAAIFSLIILVAIFYFTIILIKRLRQAKAPLVLMTYGYYIIGILALYLLTGFVVGLVYGDQTVVWFEDYLMTYGVAFFAVIQIVYSVYILLRHRNFPVSFKKNMPRGSRSLVGFGGWLYLPFVGLLIMIFAFIASLIFEVFGSLNPYDYFNLFPLEAPNFNVVWAGYLVAILGYLFLLIFAVMTLIAFIKKQKQLPRFICWLYASISMHSLLLAIIARLMAGENTSFTEDFLYSILPLLIWIPYFTMSQRVKQTFVN